MNANTQLAHNSRPIQKPGRVLVLAPQPFYDNRGTPIAVRFVVEALSELGYEIDLITLPFGSDIDIPGLTIVRLPNLIGVRSVAIGFSAAKLAFALMMMMTVARRIRRHHYVCVHAVEDAALMTALCSRRGRPPMIYDMASSLPEQLEFHGILKRLPLGRLFRAAERLIFARASVVVASAGLEFDPGAAIPARNRFVWRFPALDIDVSRDPAGTIRQELGVAPDARLLLYTGNFAGYQGLDLLFDALPKIIDAIPNALLVMVGAQPNGEATSLLERLPGAHRDHVRMLPQVPRHELGRYLMAADVLVSPRAYGKNFPLKIFDYLAAGRPIVATAIKAHTCLLDEKLAELTEANAQSFADGIVRVLQDESRRKELAAASAHYAAHHLRWSSFVQLVKTLYESAGAGVPSNIVATPSDDGLRAADKISI